jgi:hypothetical protein
MARMRPTLGQHASLILITPRVDGRWIQELMLLMRRGVVPTVLLLDAAAYGRGTNPDEARVTVGLLSDLGVACYLITPDTMNRPEARPGRLGEWNWMTLPTGMVVPVGQPQNTNWRPLS